MRKSTLTALSPLTHIVYEFKNCYIYKFINYNILEFQYRKSIIWHQSVKQTKKVYILIIRNSRTLTHKPTFPKDNKYTPIKTRK